MKHQYCLLLPVALILFVVGLTMLIVYALDSLDSYAHTKDFRAASCDVISANVTSTRECAYTEDEDPDDIIHTSSYPCLRVRVNYTDNVKQEASRLAFLYDEYSSKEARGTHDNLTCSVHVCEFDYEDNLQTVLEFQEEFDYLGTGFPCYYDPKHRSEVFRSIVTSNKMLHALLWPSLALGFGFVILVIVIFLACESLVCHDLLSGAKKARTEGRLYRLASFGNEHLARRDLQERELKAERARSWRIETPEPSNTSQLRRKASTSLLDRLKQLSVGGSLKDRHDKQNMCELQPIQRRNSVG